MEFVGIGDLHLTSSTGSGGLSAYVKESDRFVADLVIDQPLKYARKKGIKHVFFYGDICEKTRMSYDAQLALIRIIRHDPDLILHFILGNHDLFSEDPTLGHSMQIIKEAKFPNVKIYEHPTDVVIDKAPIRFLPWPHQKFTSKALNVAHVDVKGARSDSGRLYESDELSTSQATAVVGHIHTHQKVRNTHYSGTLYQTNFGENPDKFFHHGSFDSDWNIESIPVKPVYRLHTVEARTKADLKSVPSSEHDLVKLILLEGSKLVASDYKHLNVVLFRPVKSELDLVQARVEDIKSGTELEFSTDEFFREWLSGQSVSQEIKDRALKIRKRILS